MKLVPNWKEVLGGAWSVWLMVVAVLIAVADLWLRASGAPDWLPGWAFPATSAVLATMAIPARIVLQTNMSQWLQRWWADESGTVRRRAVGITAAIATAAAMAVPLISKWEGRSLVAYRDIVGVWTICDGETLGVGQGDVATDAECDRKLAARAKQFSAEIARCLPTDLPMPMRVAFVSASYNIGSVAFCHSSMSRRALAGELRGACDALLMWDKGRVNGVLQRIRGLTNRRRDEWRLCLTGVEA